MNLLHSLHVWLFDIWHLFETWHLFDMTHQLNLDHLSLHRAILSKIPILLCRCMNVFWWNSCSISELTFQNSHPSWDRETNLSDFKTCQSMFWLWMLLWFKTRSFVKRQTRCEKYSLCCPNWVPPFFSMGLLHVLWLGRKVKNDMSGQSKYALGVCNVKIRKSLLGLNGAHLSDFFG